MLWPADGGLAPTMGTTDGMLCFTATRCEHGVAVLAEAHLCANLLACGAMRSGQALLSGGRDLGTGQPGLVLTQLALVVRLSSRVGGRFQLALGLGHQSFGTSDALLAWDDPRAT